ncbi:hypothetical protein [Bacillus sp. FJAT-42315]|uniref:hypothetical protein n=1 Tax=Bacillus sp. FJAT-42315 TaxID=2014077 RepID=UPI0012FEA9B0|nr:hypothetical protein [Bacillus sp. FJAT-42315]
MAYRRICEDCHGVGRVPLIRGIHMKKVCKHCNGTGSQFSYRLQEFRIGWEMGEELIFK